MKAAPIKFPNTIESNTIPNRSNNDDKGDLSFELSKFAILIIQSFFKFKITYNYQELLVVEIKGFHI